MTDGAAQAMPSGSSSSLGRSNSGSVTVTPGVTALLERVYAACPEPRATRVRHAVESLFSRALTRLSDGTVFVLTGDIPAMWLRDSTWQLRPLLAAAHEPQTYDLLAAVVRRQSHFVLIDPYANAFNLEPNGNCWHQDFPDQSPWVFERKYELDSLAAFLDLALRLHRASGRTEHLDSVFMSAAATAVSVIAREQAHDPESYSFTRPAAAAHDQLSHGGVGAPCGMTGMSWSGFRPSDDACELPFHIPANAHAAVALEQLAALPEVVELPADVRRQAKTVAAAIRSGIERYGINRDYSHPRYSYEVDGLGARLEMDDANTPSLLSLPYLGWCAAEDPTYRTTRDWVLSPANPWFFRGTTAAGIGSRHTPNGHVWPLAIAMAGLTATEQSEVEVSLKLLETTDAGTGQLHESFHCDDPTQFTREWFSWPDMTYVHLVLRSINCAFD